MSSVLQVSSFKYVPSHTDAEQARNFRCQADYMCQVINMCRVTIDVEQDRMPYVPSKPECFMCRASQNFTCVMQAKILHEHSVE